MKQTQQAPVADFTKPYPRFTPEMKATHTILIPDMLPWHFDLLVHVMRRAGYNVEVLHNEGRAVIDEGLKHVHNDTCYPALCVIGQYIDALKSGKYDVNRVAVMILPYLAVLCLHQGRWMLYQVFYSEVSPLYFLHASVMASNVKGIVVFAEALLLVLFSVFSLRKAGVSDEVW